MFQTKIWNFLYFWRFCNGQGDYGPSSTYKNVIVALNNCMDINECIICGYTTKNEQSCELKTSKMPFDDIIIIWKSCFFFVTPTTKILFIQAVTTFIRSILPNRFNFLAIKKISACREPFVQVIQAFFVEKIQKFI